MTNHLFSTVSHRFEYDPFYDTPRCIVEGAVYKMRRTWFRKRLVRKKLYSVEIPLGNCDTFPMVRHEVRFLVREFIRKYYQDHKPKKP